MSREVHAQFCERVGVRLPRATLPLLCFQYQEDALRVLEVLPKRFAKYGLRLHPEKTRMVEFGRAGHARATRAAGRLATFDFLGLTHRCATSRNGHFTVHVSTMKKRLRRSLRAVRLGR